MTTAVATAQEVLDREPMSAAQWVIIAICLFVFALDGYDVLSIAFAAPGIAAEWGVGKAAMGTLLSLELVGMALGAIVMGNVADRYGRRPTVVAGLTIVTLGMAAAGAAWDIWSLGAARVFTGIGIGGLLASGTAMTSEYSNLKNRSFTVSLVAAGYSFGIFVGGFIAADLLRAYDWRAVFYFGAVVSALAIPLVLFFIPESVGFLSRQTAPNADRRIRQILTRLGHSAPDRFAAPANAAAKPTFAELLQGDMARVTIVLCFAYFMNLVTYYFFLKWIPSLVVDLGYDKTVGPQIVSIASLGGLFGPIALSLAARAIPIRSLLIAAYCCAAAGVTLFAFVTHSVFLMQVLAFIAGFGLLAALGGSFALFAYYFPPRLLGSGTGLVLGLGRGGAVGGPFVGGLLFAGGMALTLVAPIMAGGSLLAAVALTMLPDKRSEAPRPEPA